MASFEIGCGYIRDNLGEVQLLLIIREEFTKDKSKLKTFTDFGSFTANCDENSW